MVKTDLEDIKQATKGAGLSCFLAAEQDGMLKRAQCIGEVGVHMIILMAKAWSTELTDILKAKALSGKHLRKLLEPFVTLEERFPWQGFADLLYGHQLEILNWGVVPGFVDLDRNASNSMGGWHLLCSKFHKKPADITISVHRWSAVDANMSLKDKGNILIMSDHDGDIWRTLRICKTPQQQLQGRLNAQFLASQRIRARGSMQRWLLPPYSHLALSPWSQ
ncbi:hypothetical protein BS47DRAFT_1365529 [Hydnum rufescens UP504]|uniref:Uncharacterized protein n=1 Tax=Hydnum rufescens UP504 TaxID=1448309 RepID=A0A9P6ANH1_9AGAM|nr:hypothetical protein BS47DRAFT_1365529 [Hydnum rufescens UP504]